MKFKLKEVDRGLLQDLKAQKRLILAGLGCTLVTSLLSALAIPITKYSLQAIDDLRTPGGGGLRLLAFACLAIVALFAGKYWFTRGQMYYLAQASARMGLELRRKIFARLLRLPINYFNEKSTGSIQSVLNNDVGLYQNAVSLMRDSIEGPVKAVGAFVLILVSAWQLWVLSLLAVITMELLIRRNVRKVKKTQHHVQAMTAEYTSFTQEAVIGSRVIKALSAEQQISQRHESALKRVYDYTMQSVKVFAVIRPQMELVGALTLAGALYVCSWLARNGSLRVADIGALIIALDVINSGVRSMGNVRSNYAQVLTAAERIHREVLDDGLHDEEFAPGKTLPDLRGHVEFRNVRFTYADGTEALKEVSFEIKPGESLALVGSSGAGKSTIADLLLKFYEPSGGEILLDGIPLRDIDTAWLRSRIGIVPQQTFLFAGSIGHNLKISAPDATEEDMVRAAVQAHAISFIERSDTRFDSYIGERGIGLSGGEMQRLSIARALIRDPRILVLDEATSSLDAISERAVQEALEQAMRERTTLFIAHRLTTAARADKIVVLSKGKVLEQGTHEDLLAARGVYASMYKAFSSGVPVEA